DLEDGAALGCADGDGRLVRHHLDHVLVLGDGVPCPDVTPDDLAFGHAFADVGQLELESGHLNRGSWSSARDQLRSAPTIAGTIRCDRGRYSSSSEYGNGV